MSFETHSTERCLLTRVLIEPGDKVKRVMLWRRDIPTNIEGDYFCAPENFRDVVLIDGGIYDGEGGIWDVLQPKEANRCWSLFFHAAAWQMAQGINRQLSESFYDPPSRQRKEVLALHAEVQKKTRHKIKLAPELQQPKFAEGIMEFARVVQLAWQIGAQLIPPVFGPDDAVASDFASPSLAITSLTCMLWNEKLGESQTYPVDEISAPASDIPMPGDADYEPDDSPPLDEVPPEELGSPESAEVVA